MKTNIDELRGWLGDAEHGLRHEADRLEEKSRQITSYMRVLNAMEDLTSEVEDLKDELERKQTEIDDLSNQLERKNKAIADLQRQLLEAANQHLESEKQHLEAEAHAKPPEIHNHFESGSSAQVFNDKVTGKIIKKKAKKEKKRRWKKIVRKVL